MNIKILVEWRRLIVQAGDWSLVDIDIFSRMPEPAPAKTGPGLLLCHDPHSTTGAQVEQADEPAAGFGFAGSTSHVVAQGKVPDVRKE